MAIPDQGALDRVVRAISRPGMSTTNDALTNIVEQAMEYSARPDPGDATPASGFAATIEAAFLVANADGLFDDEERNAFTHVLLQACNSIVQADLIQSLLAELSKRLAKDGVDARARAVARGLAGRDREQQLEVLRTAALMAEISGGVATQERHVLECIARECSLEATAVDQALADAEADLAFQLD